MKKIFLSILMLCTVTFLSGCGTSTPEDPAIINAPGADAGDTQDVDATGNDADTPDADANNEETVVVENEGQVDVAVTTELAECLTTNGVKMYGTERCGHCQDQKKLFGDAFTNVDYTDCDADRQACVEAEVRGFPSWTHDGNIYPGTQSLERLAGIAGCEM